jgi:voltage-dependent potassium channel beta subunit
MAMEYRHLGATGLRVSALSFGTAVGLSNEADRPRMRAVLETAYEGGVNSFDTGESYEQGRAEAALGSFLAELGWPRNSYVITTKLYFGISGDVVNMQNTLNRKYLMQGIDGSLRRLGLDFVDVLLCHRPDPTTPIEETVTAMSDIIRSGKALYWGTSNWPRQALREACEIADRRNLYRPVVEQSEYNLFVRQHVEQEYDGMRDELGIGITAYSPLAWGLLTGKYIDGVPEGSRAANPELERVHWRLVDKENNAKVAKLKVIADRLGVPLAPFSLAWCARHPSIASVITSASRPEQMEQNLLAMEILPLLTDDVMAEIDAVMA